LKSNQPRLFFIVTLQKLITNKRRPMVQTFNLVRAAWEAIKLPDNRPVRTRQPSCRNDSTGGPCAALRLLLHTPAFSCGWLAGRKYLHHSSSLPSQCQRRWKSRQNLPQFRGFQNNLIIENSGRMTHAHL